MKLLIALSVLLIAGQSMAQDPVFYSSNNVQLYNNPAMSGLCKSFAFDMAYRHQWPELSGDYISSVSIANQYLGKGHGVSLSFFTDNAGGITRKKEIMAGYAKLFKLSENHFLSIGLQASFFQKTIDWDRMTFGDMIDPRVGVVNTSTGGLRPSTSDIDLNAGLLYYNNFLYASFSVKHLLTPNESFFVGQESDLPMLYFGEVGGKIKIKENVKLVPYFRYRNQGSFGQMQLAVKAYYKDFYLEGGMQDGDVGYGGMGYNGKLIRAGYNLVAYQSFFQESFSFAHEIFLGVNLNLFKKENENFFDF